MPVLYCCSHSIFIKIVYYHAFLNSRLTTALKIGFTVSISQKNLLLSSSVGVPIDSKFTYSSGRCSEGVGLGWWYLLSDARPGFMAGVVGKGLFLPFYNFKQEEKPNVSVLHFQGPSLQAQCALNSSSELLWPQYALDHKDDVSAKANQGFLQGGFLLTKQYDGYICQAKLLNFIPTDKQNLCRKHLKENKQIFCSFTISFPLRDCSSLVTLRKKSRTCHSYCSTWVCVIAHVPEWAWGWISLHSSAAVAYAGGQNFWSSIGKNIFLHEATTDSQEKKKKSLTGLKAS